MRKIFNGKVYDTETAKCIAEYSNGLPYNDFNYLSEDLYQKKTGEFFIHGDGGAMTRYAIHSSDNSWGGGSKIIPVTPEEARSWAEKHISAEKFEQIFGPIEEDETKIRVNLNLTSQNVENAKRIAAENGTSLSAMVDKYLSNL